jgi:hypothetical protein
MSDSAELKFVESWLSACKIAYAEPHRSLGLMKMWVADCQECRFAWNVFWLKREMDEEQWQELRTFVMEAFRMWRSCRARLVLCKENSKDKVSFKFGTDPSNFSDSTKELIVDAYLTALDELRAVN